MAGLKSLAKDTAIYGLSSIVGRFLNYLLVPLYTAVIPAASGGYGVVSNVYAYTALILVLLTFGMETGFFRFANKTDADPKHVYANALLFVGGLSLLFVTLCLAFIHPLSTFLEYPDHPDYIAMMVIVVALDSFQCIPFAYLRYQKKPMKFAAIKLFNIIGNIVLNLFFLLLCPYIYKVWLHLRVEPHHVGGTDVFLHSRTKRIFLSLRPSVDEANGELFVPYPDIRLGRHPEPNGRQDDLSVLVRRPARGIGAIRYL